MKRVFGIFEVIFDCAYLITALIISLILLTTAGASPARTMAGIMSLLLVAGDSFHLFPRMQVILKKNESTLRYALGRGKQVTSITMTIFYLLLWQIGLLVIQPDASILWTCTIYILAVVRIALCLMPQNKWTDRYPPVSWGLRRNLPFFVMGILIALFFFIHRTSMAGLSWMWLAICLSFAFYLPVVLWSNQNPKIGMLMLPKTCAYIWMLVMCLSL